MLRVEYAQLGMELRDAKGSVFSPVGVPAHLTAVDADGRTVDAELGVPVVDGGVLVGAEAPDGTGMVVVGAARAASS